MTEETLQAKIDRQQQLLERAKLTIGQYKERTEELESELEACSQSKKSLEKSIFRLSQLEPPKSSEIDSVLARTRVQSSVYACVFAKNKIYWVNEKDYAFKSKLPEILDNSCSKKTQEDTLKSIISQYEDRLKRIQEALDTSEKAKNAIQNAFKKLQVDFQKLNEEARPIGEVFNLVAESAELYDNTMECILDLDNAKIRELLKNVQVFSCKHSEGEISRAREHLGSLHRSLLDLCKRLLHSRNENANIDKNWKTTSEKLEKEIEILKDKNEVTDKERADLEKKLAKKDEEFNCKLYRLDSLKVEELSQAEQTIQMLRDEIQASVNFDYLKHVFMQFLTTNETNVQERLTWVIATLLNFTDEEKSKVHEARNPKSMFSRLLSR